MLTRNMKHKILWACGLQIQEVEYTTFIFLVIAATGSLAHEATIFYKHMASFCPPSGAVMPSLWDGFFVSFHFCCYSQLLLVSTCGAQLSFSHFYRIRSGKNGVSIDGLIYFIVVLLLWALYFSSRYSNGGYFVCLFSSYSRLVIV